jgi:hypothetical protein
VGKNQPRSSVLFATEMSEYSEERLGELIALLPPPPTSWVQAAVELPGARGAIDELVTRAIADERVRRAILADLEKALRAAGVDPRPELTESLRARLGELA